MNETGRYMYLYTCLFRFEMESFCFVDATKQITHDVQWYYDKIEIIDKQYDVIR